ncbi:MBOAT family protein [Litoribacter ruber]|uniref:MBOAT family O-acyltransferase n=1 Tax=Litoribacter ruber TaxID=702568 RepID=UPI001BDB5E82|nr:MBOAT family O-acyltransferase [Litoribacter ruber]MBT0809925.1 MBOAT family protein [Litoribacter ruber]
MLFNSLEFAIFLPIVFFLFWALSKKGVTAQNVLLLGASYFFYGWWDWRFLSLIFFSSLIDYFVGLKMAKTDEPTARKHLLWISLGVNLGFLAFFKYFNFFMDSFTEAFTFFGASIPANRLNIILPVGISFYTFQTLSYSIDIYYKRLQPTRNLLAFMAFVSFFPQLVAGPIERATNLLPQFFRERKFNYENASQGLKMMLWGFFMKVAVADRLAIYVDDVFQSPETHSWLTLSVTTVFFAFQIYGDFAGYSLIAIGCAKLFDFELMTNFRRPYFATSFKSFWGRWHISLSTWFKDYVYIPLGGSRVSTQRSSFNLMATFIISGFWHGANWTFIVWGALHGFYQILEKYLVKGNVPKYLMMVIVFALTCLAWVFFRAPSVTDAFVVISRILTGAGSGLYFGDKGIFLFGLIALLILFVNDYITEYKPDLQLIYHPQVVVRFSAILLILMYITALGVFDRSQFIYFQF